MPRYQSVMTELWMVSLVGLFFVWGQGVATAQEESSPVKAVGGTTAPEKKPGLSPYEALIKDAEVQKGVFTVYQKEDSWYFEIPKDKLGREMLWHVEAARVPADFPEGTAQELASNLVRWTRQRNKIFVSGYNAVVTKRTGPPTSSEPQNPMSGPQNPLNDRKRDPIKLSLEESGEPETLFAFPIVAESPTGDVVIDVSSIFLTEIADMNVGDILKKGGLPGGILDPQRSYIRELKSFPRNVEASVHLTYNVLGKRTASFQIHHSLTLLPDVPMKPRAFDDRVGYFTVDYSDYSGANTVGVEKKSYITRYRLEKRDVDAPLSEPINPIVYYISREVPGKWRSYFKQGVEDWNVAFEAAGFRNAIVAKDAPSEAEDPDWSPADTRYSVIRWVSTPVVNAMGPHIHDPRTGEILSAHIMIWANVDTIAQQWYYTMCSGTDPRARTLPLPEAVIGRMMRYIVSHEVGHTLGLRHNHRASTAYTVKQLRDKAFTAAHGSTASIMAYGRMNYVAQPEDGLAPESLMPRVGPYDKHAIAWGYTPIPEGKTLREEQSLISTWTAKADTNPWLVWGGDGDDIRIHFDPRVETQNVGVDRIEATRLGLKNLQRAVAYLPASVKMQGHDFRYKTSFYNAIMSAWLDQIGSVVKEIGGVEVNRSVAGKAKQYQRVGRARQKAALAFVLQNGLHRPTAFMPAALYIDIQPFTLVDSVLERQGALLSLMLAPELASVMQDAALSNDPDRYSYVEYLSDLTGGVFEELNAKSPLIEPLRRSMQRRYLILLAEAMAKPPSSRAERMQLEAAGLPGYLVATSDSYVSDYRAAGLMTLQTLAGRLKFAGSVTKDKETLAHLKECQRLVQRALLAGETPAK